MDYCGYLYHERKPDIAIVSQGTGSEVIHTFSGAYGSLYQQCNRVRGTLSSVSPIVIILGAFESVKSPYTVWIGVSSSETMTVSFTEKGIVLLSVSFTGNSLFLLQSPRNHAR